MESNFADKKLIMLMDTCASLIVSSGLLSEIIRKPTPHPPKLTKCGLCVSVPRRKKGKRTKSAEFSKSAPPQENAQRIDLVNFRGVDGGGVGG